MFALHHHPFAVDAFFRRSLMLGYAAPIDVVRALLPPQLEPDTFDDKHGFLAVAAVDTRDLRPAGFPKLFGRDFMLIGYRVFAKFRTASGRRLRGLYILRSETDRRSMVVLGNLFTQYRYELSAFTMQQFDNELTVADAATGLSIRAILNDEPQLPYGSAFTSLQQARRFAGPLPFTFSTTDNRQETLIVEGSRENWTPEPVTIVAATVPYLERLIPSGLVLSNAFVVEDIAYHWKKGRKERWAGNAGGFRG